MKSFIQTSFLLVCISVFSGCLKDQFINLPSFWTGEKDAGSGSNRISVVNFGLRKSGSIFKMNFQIFENSALKKPETVMIEFKENDDSTIWFTWASKNIEDVRLKVQGQCARSSSNPAIEFCFGNNEVRATVETTSGRTLLKFKKATQTDKPKENLKLRLDQLVGYSRMQNFSSLKEAERVYQAKESILEARGNLLPRLNTRSLFAFATTGPLALVDTIGELLPFIFPTSWLKWHQSQDFYQAELHSFAALIGNEMNAVELLALAIQRDVETAKFFQTQLEFLASVESKAKHLEELGVIKTGGSLDFSLKVRAYQQDQRQLQGLIEREKAELAYASGFSPVAAKLEIEPIEINKPQPIEISDKEFSDFVKSQSLEIKTLDFLVKASDKDIKDRQFGFLDPSSQRTFGFGYASTINIGKSQKRELEIERESMRNLLEKKVVAAVSSWRESYDLFVSAENASKDAERRFDQLIRIPLELGEISWAQSSIVPLVLEAIDNRLKYESMKISAKHAYEMARAKMDRLALSGFYEGLEVNQEWK